MFSRDPIYLIDGSGFIYRAYHAVTPLSNSKGMPTHAVYGFINILLKVLRDKAPTYLAVAFDAKGPTFRHRRYPEYKATRPAMPDDLAVQIPYIKKTVEAYNIETMEEQGVEADDLIASAAIHFAARDYPVVVISGDKDLLQLVGPNVTVWDPMKDKTWDRQAVLEKYNVPPEQLLDLFALMGDKSDNIPGICGVGPKTAEKLINQFDNLEELLTNVATLGKKKVYQNIADHRDDALLSKELIRLKCDLDISKEADSYRLPRPRIDRLKELFTELEFTRLLKTEIPVESVNTGNFHLVDSDEKLAELISLLQPAEHVVIDTETSSLDPLTAELVGISICVSSEAAYYIPIGHRDVNKRLRPGQMDRKTVLAALRPFLENDRLVKIGHNLKFDYSILATGTGIRMAGHLWDTMIASYLIDPSRRTHKLDDLCLQVLDIGMTSFAAVTDNDKRDDAFVYVPVDRASDYSCEDVYGTLRLWYHFRPLLEENNLWELFTGMEAPLVPVLAEMEMTGISIDPQLLQSLSTEFAAKLDELEKEIHDLAGSAFNINSPQQLGEVLFEKLKLPHGRKTKTGYSTDVKVLEKLAAYHPLPALIMSHRNLAKLKSTYVDKLSTLIHPKTNRIHTSFNQTITATGRLSSSNPNLQNIPIRTSEGQRIRQSFIAGPGNLFVAGDYSQIDLRVLAHYSQDKALIDAFNDNQDIHNRTAAEIFFVSPMLITKEMRRVAKSINFGIVYGMSSFGLAEQLSLSRKEAQTFIDRYFAHYTGVKEFMAAIIEQAHRDGFVTTLLNRRRILPELNSPSRTRREFAERAAINTPIQGTAADIIKLAMLKIDAIIKESGLQARMLLQIHDELVFEVPEKEVDKTALLVREAMESVIKLDVPLLVNMKSAANLAEL